MKRWGRIGCPDTELLGIGLTTCLLLWLGLYLREPRLRALLPFRGKAVHE